MVGLRSTAPIFYTQVPHETGPPRPTRESKYVTLFESRKTLSERREVTVEGQKYYRKGFKMRGDIQHLLNHDYRSEIVDKLRENGNVYGRRPHLAPRRRVWLLLRGR